MKLLRYGPAGREKPGLLDADGKIRDLSGQIADVDGQALTSETLGRLAKLDPATLPDSVDGFFHPRIGCPVGSVSKFVAVGLNYADHAAEANMPLPSEPIIFFKATSCIVGPNDDVILPQRAIGRLNSASSSAARPATSRSAKRWITLQAIAW